MELKDEMADLVRTREEIDRARGIAMRSYLESKPLIDRLEKSKASLEKARSRRSMIGSSELRSQLEAIEAALREKKEGEAMATRSIHEMNRAAEEARSDIDSLKAEIEEGRRTRQKLKQALRVKRQKLRANQLTLHAVRIESEAIEGSLEYAVQQADLAKTEVTVMQLDQEEYWELRRRAEEEESMADWRITASIQQKAAAEESRNLALKRLKDVKDGKRLRRRPIDGVNEKKIDDREQLREEENKKEENDYGERRPEVVTYGRRATPIARTRELTEIRNGMRPRRARVNGKKKAVENKKKKQSIFVQIRRFFAKRFAGMFW